MKDRRPLQIGHAPRFVQPNSGTPIGWLASIKDQITRLQKEVEGVALRLARPAPKDAEPAAVVGKMVFSPETYTFAFDYLQNGVSSVQSQYVLRDGMTYEIPVVFPPPGVFIARAAQVSVVQRLFVPDVGVMQVPMHYGNFFMDQGATGATQTFQTKKYSFPDNTDTSRIYLSRRLSFLWNLIDMKNGVRFSDELMSDLLFLPQDFGTPRSGGSGSGSLANLPTAATNGYLEFPTPWLFERDAQLTFQFRPITPVIQPTANSGYSPYPFDDREQTGIVRDSSVTVQIEIHGTRYLSLQDAARQGALV
jgi:hypothetical protein